MKRLLFIFISFCTFCAYGQNIDETGQAGYDFIKASDLKSHLSVLTSDTLEGRETTFPGQKKAADYIAGIFRKLKLKTIGDTGSYFQRFNVEIIRNDPETKITVSSHGKSIEYKWEKDFISPEVMDTVVSGPVAFAGFTDSEIDTAYQAKLKGRIVFTFLRRKNYAKDAAKTAAIRRYEGAAAVLMIPDTVVTTSFQETLQIFTRSRVNKGIMKIKDRTSEEQLSHIRFLISPEIAEYVLKSTGKSLEQMRDLALESGNFTPLFIDDVILSINSKNTRVTKQTENIAGLLPGSDPYLKNQVIAITAHYDHLGKNKDGIIYPGADDDGSGTATVLELAEAFSANPIKQKRSLLFITFTGEEEGLLGSQYFVNNSIIPLNRITADLNTDMIGRMDAIHGEKGDSNYIYVIGSDKISLELDSLLQIANKESENLSLDYKYNSEYDPEQLYRRSDHYNFAKNGIPVVFFFDGIHEDYHKPTDTIDKILFKRMVRIGHLIYKLGWKLANIDCQLTKKPD